MRKRLIVAAIIFGIASLAGISTGIRSSFAADNAVIDENDKVVLHENVYPKARPEFDVGLTDPSLPMKRMILLLKLAPEKHAELDRFLAEQQDPSSPNFHRWLTPEEFGKRFGRSPEEIATVKNWLVTHGFTIEETAKSGTWINFSGTVADVENAFHANMHDYRVEGHLHHANSTDPSIPRTLADLVAGPVSLHNFPHKAMHTPPRPMPEGKLQPNFTDPADGSHSLAPGDFAVIYDVNNVYNLGYDGTGVTIAIVGRTHPDAGKWDTFRSSLGLPYNPPVVTVNGPDPGDLGPYEDSEADLDVEWSGAVAKGATINVVVSASTPPADGSDLSAQYIVDQDLAPIMSDSFGECEPDMGSTLRLFYNNLWKQAASQGITVFVATGDTGAYGCTNAKGLPSGGKAVNGLASTPYNIAVGGTQFRNASAYWNRVNSPDGTSASGYIPEVAWNDWNQGYDSASGGGASAFYSKPAWQVCPGVPNDGARDVPDVSLNADDVNVGYRVYTCTDVSGSFCPSNSWSIFGGTSCGTPSFAGIMALIVQSAGGQRQGNVNSTFYQLGKAQYGRTSGAIAVYHDITSGNNGFGASLPGYSCKSGYDRVTGLGSVNVTNLFLAFQEGGALRVTISPTAVVSAGATWNVDNGAWNASGATVSGISAGSHTVNFQDIPGWNTPASRTVIISHGRTAMASGKYVLLPPAVESFLIDNGAGTTSSRTVTLNNTASGSPTYYKASQSPTFLGAVWKPYAVLPSFTLSAGNETKTVYFKVKNALGSSAKVSASIVLAQLPTVSSFKINGGAASIISQTVKLNNTATISPTQFMASEDPNFDGASWLPYSTAPQITLSAGSGTKTVYFKVENNAGESNLVSDIIQLIVRPTATSF